LPLALLDHTEGKAGRVSGEELAHKGAIDGQDRQHRLNMTHPCSIVVQICAVKVRPASFCKGLLTLIASATRKNIDTLW
jgi:hypothetical protein